MDCLPAIDLRGGRCVRLYRGDFEQETIYGDPIEQAERYVDQGAPWLHVVDLDAARGTLPDNTDVVAEILRRVSVPVEVGGGVRDERRCEELLDQGAARVVLGTAAAEEPERVVALAKAYPGRIAIGLDHRVVSTSAGVRREVAVRGWEAGGGHLLEEVLARYESTPLGAVVVTNIALDGTLEGPDLAGYEALLRQSELPIVASGGISGVADLEALRDLRAGGRRLSGAVVGRALLSGAISVEQAVAACVP